MNSLEYTCPTATLGHDCQLNRIVSRERKSMDEIGICRIVFSSIIPGPAIIDDEITAVKLEARTSVEHDVAMQQNSWRVDRPVVVEGYYSSVSEDPAQRYLLNVRHFRI